MLKKKLLVLHTSVLLGLGSTLAIPSVHAETNSQKLQQANQNIAKVQSELTKLEQQIQKVDQAMKENNQLIVETESNIKTTRSEIAELEKEIKQLNDSIEKRTDILKKRALSLQESGGNVSYLEVIMGSQSFSDFVDRVVAVAQIADADSNLVKQQEQDKAELEKKQDSVAKKLEDLVNLKTDLNGMKSMILEQKQQNDQLKAELKKEEQSNLSVKNQLEKQARQSQVSVQYSGESESNNGGGTVAYTAPTNSGSLSDVIRAGYKYIGNSAYKFGGGRTQSDINNGLFDCSGFVHWAFAQAGISVGSSTDSLKNSGTRVSANQMQPGDLVFFNTYKQDGHVGIYVGGGQFIGSQSSTGVAIANMSSGYWKQHFSGRVVRIK
jgi:peptidoglycan hydrolase CwlO-like protein